MQQVAVTDLVNACVFTEAGNEAGVVVELIVDPGAGLVRFARLRTTDHGIVLLPWAALKYQESLPGFTLTQLGTELVEIL